MSSTGFVSRLRYARAAPMLVRRVIEPDLVYGRHLLSLCVAARWGVPVFFETHQAPSRIERLVERRLFRCPNFARLVVISEALRDEYRRCHPDLPAQQILVAPDAADLPDSTDGDAAVSIRREGRLQVGFVGHLYPGKGMEMVAALARNMPDVDFQSLVSTAESSLMRTLVLTAYNSAARRADLLRLRWSDVDLDGMHREIAWHCDNDLDIGLPGNVGQCPQSVQLGELSVVVGVGD